MHFRAFIYTPKVLGLWFISPYWIKIKRWGFMHADLQEILFKKVFQNFNKLNSFSIALSFVILSDLPLGTIIYP